MTEMSISREDKPEPLEPGKIHTHTINTLKVTDRLADINKWTFNTRR